MAVGPLAAANWAEEVPALARSWIATLPLSQAKAASPLLHTNHLDQRSLQQELTVAPQELKAAAFVVLAH